MEDLSGTEVSVESSITSTISTPFEWISVLLLKDWFGTVIDMDEDPENAVEDVEDIKGGGGGGEVEELR